MVIINVMNGFYEYAKGYFLTNRSFCLIVFYSLYVKYDDMILESKVDSNS